MDEAQSNAPNFNTLALPAGLSVGVIPLCSVCGAAVPPAGQETHREWHAQLPQSEAPAERIDPLDPLGLYEP